MRAPNRHVQREFNSSRKDTHWGRSKLRGTNDDRLDIPRYLPGHPDYIKVFANPVAADEWCNQNDPEGVAFEYEVLE